MLSQDKKKAPTAGFLVVPALDDAVAYYSRVFGATEDERYQDTRGKTWYAVVHLFDLPLQLMEPFPSMGLYAPAPPQEGATDANLLIVNVRDVDATFGSALRVGSTPLVGPQHDAIDGIRYADFRDPFGHRWRIKLDRNPEIRPALVVPNLDTAVQFHTTVFGARERSRSINPIDKTSQSLMTDTTGSLLLLEPSPSLGLAPIPVAPTYRDEVMLALTVPDVDATYAAAIKAGATSIMAPHDEYWGDRYAEFRLPTSPIRASACEDTPTPIAPTEMLKTFNKFLADNNNPLSPADVLGDKVLGP